MESSEQQQQFISVRLPVATVRRAEDLARAQDRSRSSLIRQAITRYVGEQHDRDHGHDDQKSAAA